MPKPRNTYGTAANDTITGTAAGENIYGYAGDDTIDGGGGADVIQGGDGDDQLFGGDGDDRLYGDGGANYVDGGAGNDTVGGGDGNDTVLGGIGDDRVIGHLGDDNLSGGDGNDVVIGEWGADVLWGGSGADVFQYGWGFDSTTRTDWFEPDPLMTYGIDLIADFESGVDVIDLSRIDANLTTPITQVKGKGGQSYIGSDAFQIVPTPEAGADEPAAGQLTLSYDAATNITTINGYMDAVAGADFTLFVTGPIVPGTDLIL